MIGYLALKGTGVLLLMFCIVLFFSTLSFQAPLSLEDPGFIFLRSMGNAPPHHRALTEWEVSGQGEDLDTNSHVAPGNS